MAKRRYGQAFWERHDEQPTTFARAEKQPWECESYAEFLASLPDDEQSEPPIESEEVRP